jgi:hypothetical protein
MSNATEFKKGDFPALPEGDYLIRMSRYSESPTNAGNGVLGKAGFEVVSGESKGRLVFHNFLVEHTTPKAQEIGNSQLDSFLKAVGVNDGLEGIGNDRTRISEYLELPFTASLVIEAPKEYAPGKISKERNKIKTFKRR